MSSSIARLPLVTRFSILRFLRDPASTIVTIGLPLVLIPVMGTVFARIGAFRFQLDGTVDTMAFFAIGIVVMFQLFGGRFSMDSIRQLLLSEKKWRVYAAPCSPAVYASGVIIASTLLNLLQGVLLVVFSRLALGVHFGGVVAVLLVLAGTSLLAQLVYVVILLVIRNLGAAVTVGWLFAWGSAALGGLIFPLPQDVPVWRFMATYGTPYSLAQTALATSAAGGPVDEVALCIGLLYGLSALFAVLLVLVGRRKLA